VFDHSSVLGPSAQRLDEEIRNHELGCANGSGVHAEHIIETPAGDYAGGLVCGVHGALPPLLIRLPDFKCAGYL